MSVWLVAIWEIDWSKNETLKCEEKITLRGLL